MDELTNTACEECNQFDLGARRCRHVACRESIQSLKLENEHLKERLQSARDELMEHEEEEGGRCPEDVGFLEYTDALEKQLAKAREESARLDWLLSFASIDDVGDEDTVFGLTFRIEDCESSMLGGRPDWTPRQFIDAAIARNAAADGG